MEKSLLTETSVECQSHLWQPRQQDAAFDALSLDLCEHRPLEDTPLWERTKSSYTWG